MVGHWSTVRLAEAVCISHLGDVIALREARAALRIKGSLRVTAPVNPLGSNLVTACHRSTSENDSPPPSGHVYLEPQLEGKLTWCSKLNTRRRGRRRMRTPCQRTCGHSTWSKGLRQPAWHRDLPRFIVTACLENYTLYGQ